MLQDETAGAFQLKDDGLEPGLMVEAIKFLYGFKFPGYGTASYEEGLSVFSEISAIATEYEMHDLDTLAYTLARRGLAESGWTQL